jgi:CBS domain containing-hemolysin-like protein
MPSPARIAWRLGRPLARGLASLERRVAREDGEDPDAAKREALLDIVDEVGQAEGIEEEDLEMIQSVVELGQTITREVMVPRTAMITIPSDHPLRRAMSLFLRSGHSRVPVTGEDEDDIVGIAYLKDAALTLQRDHDAGADPVTTIARQAFFVPESKPVDDLLRELQKRGVHMAIVVDEYGGVAGLVTIEDVLEEIVGELVDEHDPDPPEIEDLGDGVFRVPSALPLDELSELFDREISDDAVDTVGGLLTTALGRVPIVGARAQTQGLELTAERVEGRRKQLATILVRDIDEEDEA